MTIDLSAPNRTHPEQLWFLCRMLWPELYAESSHLLRTWKIYDSGANRISKFATIL